MGFEIENKYKVTDLLALEAGLARLGAKAEAAIIQRDSYLAHPSRDFAATNEAFRIRRDGDTNRLTYKGPKHEGPTKTREELEIAFAPGDAARDDMRTLFDRLGFRPVLTIEKTRRSHHLEWQGLPFDVAIDEAKELGTFVEVETVVDSSDTLAASQAALMSLAHSLGLSEPEPRSYLRMQLEGLGMIAPSRP